MSGSRAVADRNGTDDVMTKLRLRTSALASALGILALLAPMVAGVPVGAQLDEGSCPSTVDTIDEGWICSLLILATPTDSPSDDQIVLWSEVLRQRGRSGVADGIVFSDASVEAKVDVIYETQLDRQADPGGLAHWRDRVQASRTELAAEFGIFGSAEYLSRFESPEAFVNDQYRYYLGREASLEERAHWAGRLTTGALSNSGITRGIATSREAGNVRAAIVFEDFARRAPDPGGFQHWSSRAASHGLFPTIVDFARSPEMVTTLGRFGRDMLGEACIGTAGGPDDPRPVAATFMDAWQRGDVDCADAISSEEVVETMFGVEPGAAPATLTECVQADHLPDPHADCTWVLEDGTIVLHMNFSATAGWFVFDITIS